MKIKIYQIPLNEHTAGTAFADLTDVLTQHKDRVPAELYEKVYEGQVEAFTLEDVFYIFNERRPADYFARSMSISDVVEVITDENRSLFYYCRTIGFQRILFDVFEVAKALPKKEKPVPINKFLVNLLEVPENKNLLDLLERDSRVLTAKMRNGNRTVFFYSDIAAGLLSQIAGTEEHRWLYRTLTDSKQVCPCCKTRTNHFFVTYRNNHGCVGKSVECGTCTNLSDEALHKVHDAAEKGDFKTVESIFGLHFDRGANHV